MHKRHHIRQSLNKKGTNPLKYININKIPHTTMFIQNKGPTPETSKETSKEAQSVTTINLKHKNAQNFEILKHFKLLLQK